MTLRTSLVEQNHGVGVLVQGSQATIESTVVRDTQPRSDGTSGNGIWVQESPSTPGRASLWLRTSLVERNHDTGVFVSGSDATVESTDTPRRRS